MALLMPCYYCTSLLLRSYLFHWLEHTPLSLLPPLLFILQELFQYLLPIKHFPDTLGWAKYLPVLLPQHLITPVKFNFF